MANVVCNSFKKKLFNGDYALSAADTFVVRLVTSGISTSSTAQLQDGDSWTEVSAYEVTGTGYTAGGQVLSGLSVTEDDTNNWAKWDAADVTWPSSTFSTSGAFIVASADNQLLGYVDFGSIQSPSNGNFTITWNDNGVMTGS